jgi:trimeric autotransporter adhesin
MTSNTPTTRRFRVSPALILSCVALFVALSGSALAVGLAKNSVRSAQIVDGTVRTVDLKDAAVTGTKIGPEAVGATQIAANAVSSGKVADQSLTADDLGADSVGSSEIQAGAIRSSELGPIVQATNSAAVAKDGVVSVTATCPEGTTVISGGAQPANFGVELTSTLRQAKGWLAQAKNNSGAASSLTAFAYCLSGGGSN